MRVFKLKKGGETENVEETLVILNRDIDSELLKRAINICADDNLNIKETLEYLDEQLRCIDDFTSADNLFTFYC